MAKLKDLSVSFLSLVASPATGKGLTLKAADGQRPAAFDLVVKNDDMMRAYGVVYAPDQEDAHGDTADADTIRKAQAEFMREGRLKNIDTEHSFTSEMAYVAESWLVRKGDKLFPDEPEGSWAVGIQINDPDLWSQRWNRSITRHIDQICGSTMGNGPDRGASGSRDEQVAGSRDPADRWRAANRP